jgi:hypothetical protein
MRTQFISQTDIDQLACDSPCGFFTTNKATEAILDLCSFEPFSICDVDGGYMCFESEDDQEVGNNQL